MIVTRKIQGVQGLAEFLRGRTKVTSTVGTNGANSPVLTDTTATFDDGSIATGDRVYVSGESTATVFLVQSIDGPTQITLDNNIVAAHTANATYRVHQPPVVDIGSLVAGPEALAEAHDTFMVAWDSAVFGA